MAREVQIILRDDLDGSVADETVVFGLDLETYEIDLKAEHAAELRASLQKWIAVARPAAVRPPRPGNPEVAQMRQWLLDHGYTVPARGRISASLQEIYRLAQTGKK